MRLDKFVSQMGPATRREVAAACRRGRVRVNGETVRDPARHIDPETDEVTLDGAVVAWTEHVYVMLNKPAGCVSATEDAKGLPVVLSLLPPDLQKRGLFPCGRLDRDTVGLLLLSDDGPLTHRLLSPRCHVEKRYRFALDAPLDPDAEERCRAGLTLESGETFLPAALYPDADRTGGEIVLCEGRFHQIKRMTAALGGRVTALERISFGPLVLDPALPRGGWRYLTEDEVEALRAATPL
ncbi:MAG: rRNA pseudouridine synthase [Clostridia bacterium]|nr:rRNA pseudouridine synthase [Clostridia bacterium]